MLHYQDSIQSPDDFLKTKVDRTLLITSAVMAVLYFMLLAFWFPRGNHVLFSILIFGEIFHLWQTLAYIYTMWDTTYTPYFNHIFTPRVDVFITVAGEPVDIVRQTALAAKAMSYKKFTVYLLNDGYVAKKDNWEEIENLARELEIECITRTVAGGAKAGNINNGLANTDAAFVAIFDADQVPHRDFLKKMMGYLIDPEVGFVQSPQYYKNHELNEVTSGAWEQQELFFGPICKGKNRLNSTFMCGTNMVIRRRALLAAGGMCETNIAEDFLTSLFMHEQGWKSIYVPKVLAEGLAPEDFLSYYKQQFRWARGSLEVLFKHNPLFNRRLTWAQKIQYLSSASYYFSGVIILLNILLPLVFFFTGLVPINLSTMSLALVFLPYIFLNLLVLKLSSQVGYTFRALGFSISSFTIHLNALWAVLTNQKTVFSVTSKKQLNGNFLYLVIPHIIYFGLTVAGLSVAIMREGVSAAVATNLSWILLNAALFVPFMNAAFPTVPTEPKDAFKPTESAGSFSLMSNEGFPPILNRRSYMNKIIVNKKRVI